MRVKLGAIAALVAGLALAAFVLLRIGIAPVLDAIASVGWGGFALIVLSWFVIIALTGTAWYALLAGYARWLVVIAARQLRDAASDLLPFTTLGGIVIGTRAVILSGLAASRVFATQIVDVTAELAAHVIYVGFGLAFSIVQLRASAALAPYTDALILGLALLVPGVAVFVVLQKRGGKLAEQLAGRYLPAAVSHTEAFTQTLNGLYGRPWRLALSFAAHLMGWIASGAWLWMVMRLCGAQVGFFSALAIESLLGALRNATVFVPSAVGVQEAGYAALAPVFGVGPEIGLAASLLKRAHDIVVGVPVLLIWQAVEGKRAWARPNRSEP